MSFLFIVLIAVSLSMDAFSLSLAYGTLNIDKKNIIILTIMIGIFHLFMPFLGLFLGNKILKWIPIEPDIIVFIILTFIGIEMIIDSKKHRSFKKMNFFQLVLFSLAVSIDSFSVGIGLNLITFNYLSATLVFSFTSGMFTYLGLILGNKINYIMGSMATIMGGLILIIIGLFYLL
ncbi:MAG: manganese efflux pump [Bacilli bacterium]|nr:manganese efflux pump [Bacilli bacterium]MDD4808641.1 manganese efflux pump [Bacilli bacterium]